MYHLSTVFPWVKRIRLPFSRDQLMNEMYSDYRVVSDRAVDTHIKNLRKKLGEASGGAEMIESVYGLGYRFVR